MIAFVASVFIRPILKAESDLGEELRLVALKLLELPHTLAFKIVHLHVVSTIAL